MKYLTWYVLACAVVVYSLVVALIGFAGPVSIGIHFGRIAASIAGCVIYLQMLPIIFREVPAPRRDYLLASINFFLLSLVSFSFLNSAHRIFGTDNDVFTSAVAGLFSVFAIMAAVLAIIAPDTEGSRPKMIAVIIGIIVTFVLAIFDPVFR